MDSSESKSGEPMKPCPHCRKEISALAKKCPYCQSDVRSFANRHPIMIVFLVVVALIILISIIGAASNSGSNNPASTTPIPSVQVATAQPSGPCDNFNDSNATSSINYPELNKDPSLYNGTDVVYSGQVVQIQQNPDGTGIIRLAVTKTAYGWDPNNIIYVAYSNGTDAVDNDVVKIYGQLTGSETYTSEANYQITIPSMTACEIDDQAQAATATPQATIATPQAPAPAPTQAQPTANPTPTTPPTPKTWHTVTTITTANTENTPPFNIQGSEWRATWNCQAAIWGQYDSAPDASAMSTSGGFPDQIANPTTCPSGDMTYFYDGPGMYYLSIDVYSAATMTVTVEDYY
jgi:hypothetical protein